MAIRMPLHRHQGGLSSNAIHTLRQNDLVSLLSNACVEAYIVKEMMIILDNVKIMLYKY